MLSCYDFYNNTISGQAERANAQDRYEGGEGRVSCSLQGTEAQGLTSVTRAGGQYLDPQVLAV